MNEEPPILDQTVILPDGFRAWAVPGSKLKVVSLSSSLLLAVICLVVSSSPIGLALGLLFLLIASSLTILIWRVGYWLTVNVNEGTLLVRDVRGLDRALTGSASLRELSRAEVASVNSRSYLMLVWQGQETPSIVIAFDSPAKLSQAAELLMTAEVVVHVDA